MSQPYLRFCLLTILLKCTLAFTPSYGQGPMSTGPLDDETLRHAGFDHYGIAEGMSQSSATDIAVDQSGYIWVATQDGLNRFDGYQFTSFRHELDNDNSISANSIFKIYNDTRDRLWIGTTSGGLNVLDKSSGEVTKYYHDAQDPESLKSNNVRTIAEDHKGNIWVGSESGLNLIDGATLVIGSIDIDLNEHWISALCTTDNGIVWIGTLSGLIRYDSELDERTIYKYDPDDPRSISNHIISDIAEGSDGTIWIGTRDGLNRYLGDGSFQKYYPQSNQEGKLNDNYIETLFVDKDNHLWIGTEDGGVNVMTAPHYFSNINSEIVRDKEGKGAYRVKDINQDRDGNIWIGLWGKGLVKLKLEKPQFQTYRYNSDDTNSIRFNHVSGIYEDRDGLVWIATYGGGVSKWDRAKNLFYNYQQDLSNLNSLNGNRLFSFTEDGRGDLWISGENVLQIYNEKENQFTTVPYQDSLIFNNNWPLALDEKGHMWVGTIGDGLLQFDKDRKLVRHYKHHAKDDHSISSDGVLAILHEDDERIWLATTNGLNRLNPKTGLVTRYFHDPQDHLSISHNRLSSLLIDQEDNLWVATLFGLNKMVDRERGSFLRYDMRDGLPNDVIYCILSDDQGYIWMSTNRGISRLDPEAISFTNFDISDGLQDYEFNRCSCFKSEKTGELYFGGINGFNVFNPAKVSARAVMPSTVFTSFTQYYSKEEGQRSDIDYFISKKESVILSYDQNILTFTVAALDYNSAAKIKYRYRLKGAFGDRWFDLGDKRDITFSSLDPGQYTLEATNTNSIGIWNTSVTSLDIIIKPPWYKTLWAYIAYGTLLSLILYALYMIQRRRLWLKTQLAFSEKEALQLKTLDEQKNNLYNNITHEFRTPLTVILGLTNQMSNGSKNTWKSNVEMISRNGRKLLDLVNQMLELTKLQSGNTKPNYIQADVMNYLSYLIESYQSYALGDNKNLTLYTEPSSLLMDFDPEKLRRIIDNLISNALKFTPEYGRIKAVIKGSEGLLNIEISDTGVGISEKDLPHIFERFYQVDSSTTRQGGGTGIGLALVKELVDLMEGNVRVESSLDSGSIFIITLPINNTAELTDQPHLDSYEIIRPEANGNIEEKLEDSEEGIRGTGLPLLLIVEDNPDVISYLKSCVRKDYNLAIAKNGVDGLELAFEKIPDIVLSDVMMPEMNGYELCEKLKTDQRTSHIPVILLTAKASQQDRLTGLSSGADAYLAKPFSEDELLVRLEKLIDVRRKIQQAFSYTHVKKNAESSFLEKLNRVILDHLSDEDFDVVRLCRSIGMSRTQLHRKITGVTGHSTGQYIKNFRLAEAKKLLLETDLSVAEVAYEVGFKYPNNFSTAFRAHFGVQPNETRK